MSKMKKLWEVYQTYQILVQNRVAHSINCDPSDLNDELVLNCFMNGMSSYEAARVVEHDLMQEVPF